MTQITMTAIASTDGLRAVTAVHDLGAGWPELGSILTGAVMLDCARRAGERGGIFTLQIVADGGRAGVAW